MVSTHRTMLRAFIGSMIRDSSLADDTLSDVTVAIFQSWERYDSTRAFPPWARGVARRVALANLRKQSRQPCMLEEDVLEAAALKAGSMGDESELDLRKDALAGCMERLPTRHRQLIGFRYFDERSVVDISGLVGKSAASLYVVFHRLYKFLRDCVVRKLRLL
jgi:RNA polymerase sigma-70 factor, ECF subfamily